MTYFSGYTSGEIIDALSGSVINSFKKERIIKHLLIDSRMLVVPESSIFFAIVTENNDGHKYIERLLEKGVRVFVVSEDKNSHIKDYPDAEFILVDETLNALQKLTSYHRKKHKFPVLAITGSNGKTIVKEWLFQLLNDKLKIIRSPKSYNSQIGVPLSVWQMDMGFEIGIFEAGISMPGEMDKLESILLPDYGLFTNIGPAHDEGFNSKKEKIREKLKLFKGVKKLIYCADFNGLHCEILEWSKSHSSVELCPWSKKEGFNTRVLDIKKSNTGSKIELLFKGKNFSFEIPFYDAISVENAIHCVTFLCNIGYTNNNVSEKTSKLQPVAMRMELRKGINNCSIINDSYNSDLHSLSIALDFLSIQLQHPKKRLILSDILQTGIPEEQLYEQVASLTKAKGVTHLTGIGNSISRQSSSFDSACEFFPDTDTFIRNFNFEEMNNEAILIKGARPFGFERISNLLQQKDHQTVLEINLDALVHNLKVYKFLIAPKTKIMAMVKASSYGSGSYEIASVLSRHGCNYLGVAYADEGKELRNNGISLPIIVMNPELQSLDILHHYQLEPEIYSLNLFERIAQSAKTFQGISSTNPFPVHIKIDTGMHRLGIMENETDKLIRLSTKYPHIKIVSVFSHLAASDMTQYDDFTKSQIALFKKISNKIEENIGYKVIKHICNSTAVSRFPEAHFDMVRLGIGLYGVDNFKKTHSLLKNVSSFKSVISQIKTIKTGESIGYSRSAITEKDIKIAIVPVGYADGLSRKLSNGKVSLVVNGKFAPIIGNISMDMCTIDITGINASEGDEVVIFNDDYPLDRIANSLETIPYEILTSISYRVKRIYFRD